MAKQSRRESVVKQGGMAQQPSNADDVTRDTHGDSQPAPVKSDKEQRVAEADRAAAAAGIPGVAVPETASEAASAPAQDEQSPGTGETGDRMASRRDVEKLKPKHS